MNPFERVKHSRVAIEGVSHHEWALCCEITFFPSNFPSTAINFAVKKLSFKWKNSKINFHSWNIYFAEKNTSRILRIA